METILWAVAVIVIYFVVGLAMELHLPATGEAKDYMNAEYYSKIYNTDFATGAQINEAKKLNENLEKLNNTKK